MALVYLSAEDEAFKVATDNYTPAQVVYERVLRRVCTECDIPVNVIADKVRAALKAKLWRMGNRLSKAGGIQRQQLLREWECSN